MILLHVPNTISHVMVEKELQQIYLSEKFGVPKEFITFYESGVSGLRSHSYVLSLMGYTYLQANDFTMTSYFPHTFTYYENAHDSFSKQIIDILNTQRQNIYKLYINRDYQLNPLQKKQTTIVLLSNNKTHAYGTHRKLCSPRTNIKYYIEETDPFFQQIFNV